MKIRCLDPDTFLLSMKQHTILVNCPLKTRHVRQDAPDNTGDDEDDELADYTTPLDNVLAPYHPLAKQAARYSTDTTYQEQPSSFTWSRMIALDGVDISTIDVILLTQYEHLLGLPYLTEYLGYQGKIVATEPTIEFARQRMEELVHYRSVPGAAAPTMTMDGDDLTMDWQSIYTLKDIASCIEKIQPVRYNERMSLFSTLHVMAYSSGYSLGSSNWLIETSMKKIAVLSASSSRTELHPAVLDHSLLHSADVILVSGISSKDVDDPLMAIHPPPAYERQINKVLSHIAGTLGARHNVILPIEITSGLVYDLIWMIHSHLRSLGMELGPESHQIPMYMISPVAEQSLQYANICGEWMTPEYQEQLWRPNVPLPHGELMKSRALTTFTTMAAIPLSKTKDLRSSPCLVFTGDHQVLSHGALDWFIQNWGTDANNLCLFTDANLSQDQLHQYDKVDMTVLHLPLDTRLTIKQVLDLIRLHWRTVTTKHLILPRLPSTSSHENLHGLDNAHIQLYSPGEMISIDLDFEWEHVSISSELARDVKPVNVPWMATTTTTKRMAPIVGDLQVYNNQLVLHRMTSHLDTNLALMSSSTQLHTHQLNSTNVAYLRDRLHKIGIDDITTEQADQCLILAFPSSSSPSLALNRLEVYPNQVVIKAVDEESRVLIGNALIDGQ